MKVHSQDELRQIIRGVSGKIGSQFTPIVRVLSISAAEAQFPRQFFLLREGQRIGETRCDERCDWLSATPAAFGLPPIGAFSQQFDGCVIGENR